MTTIATARSTIHSGGVGAVLDDQGIVAEGWLCTERSLGRWRSNESCLAR
jgi:hypothetical protein